MLRLRIYTLPHQIVRIYTISFFRKISNWTLYLPIILAFGVRRQDNQKFKVILSCTVRMRQPRLLKPYLNPNTFNVRLSLPLVTPVRSYGGKFRVQKRMRAEPRPRQ